jgi:DNA-nicking Smr family endonuclease
MARTPKVPDRGDVDGNGEGDAGLFKRALADTVPLKKKPKERANAAAPAQTPAEPSRRNPVEDRAKARLAQVAKLPKGAGARPANTAAPVRPLELGDTAGVDRRTADRFKRGRMEIDGRLDLHGLYQEEAHTALVGFIQRSAREGKRCVVVITGKGRVSEGGGVLRREVPRWLNQPELRSLVLSIARAQVGHGGDGAIYVLLKRQRG